MWKGAAKGSNLKRPCRGKASSQCCRLKKLEKGVRPLKGFHLGQVTHLFEPKEVEESHFAAKPGVWLPTGGCPRAEAEVRLEQQVIEGGEEEEAAMQMMGEEYWMT